MAFRELLLNVMLENVIVSPVPELVTPQMALPDPKYICIPLLD